MPESANLTQLIADLQTASISADTWMDAFTTDARIRASADHRLQAAPDDEELEEAVEDEYIDAAHDVLDMPFGQQVAYLLETWSEADIRSAFIELP